MRKILLLSRLRCLWLQLHGGMAVPSFRWFSFRDDALPVIDGDLSEWSSIPRPYQLINEDYTREVWYGTEHDPADLAIKVMSGYNPNLERIYIAAQIFDDYHERDHPLEVYRDDVIEIAVDGDHSGGSPDYPLETDEEKADEELKARWAFSNNQWYGFAVPPYTGFAVWKTRDNNPWLSEEPTTLWAYTFDGEEAGESTYYYEFSTIPYDDAIPDDREGSIKSDLAEGGYMGLLINVADFDGPIGDKASGDDPPYKAYDSYYTIVPGNYGCCSEIADAFLAPLDRSIIPTAVDHETWGRIKARFH